MIALYIFLIVLAVVVGLAVANKKDDGKGKKKKEQVPYSMSSRGNAPSTKEESDLLAVKLAVKNGFYKRKLGGIVVIDKSSMQTSIAIEYDGPHKGSNGVKIEYVASPTVRQAEIYLRGEDIDKVKVEKPVYNAFLADLRKTCKSKNGLIDAASGCAIFAGYVG